MPSKVICEAISAIGIHLGETYQVLFYKRFLLPFFLELAFKLEENDLEFLSAQVSPSELKKSMPFLSDDDIKVHSAEIRSFLSKKSLSVKEKSDIKVKLQIYGSDDSASVLSALFESDHLNIAPFFHLVFNTFETLIDHYSDTDKKLLLSMILLRSNFSALKHIGEISISSGGLSAVQRSPGEKRYQIRYDELLGKVSATATRVNSSVSADLYLKPYIGLVSSSLGMISSLVVIGKYGQKREFTWEDKRDLTLAAIYLTSNSISFINFFSKVFKEEITSGFLAPASFIFAAMKGKDSIRDALNEKDYPAVALHSYSIATSGLKTAEAMLKMMHRLKVIHVKEKLGMEAAKLVFRKGYMFSRFFTAASKFTGPVGLAIAMYQLIELCESWSQQIRRKNNIVWDQTCKFVEAINALISTEVRYHDYTVPKLDIETIIINATEPTLDVDYKDKTDISNEYSKTGQETSCVVGATSLRGHEKPMNWKTYFNRIVKTGSANSIEFFDFEKVLMQFDRETNRSKMYETRGISFSELQKSDAIALYNNGDIPMKMIAEMVGMDEVKLKKVIHEYEKKRQVELEEHWRINYFGTDKEKEEIHRLSLEKFTES